MVIGRLGTTGAVAVSGCIKVFGASVYCTGTEET